jgi:hypothetical protein
MSDTFDRNLVLFIFVIVFLYMQFLSIQSKSRSGWNNLTCNPLNLFTNSLFQSQEEANKDFEKCIINLSAATTTELLQKEVAQQGEVLATMTRIENNYNNLAETVNTYKNDIVEASNDYTEQIEEIEKSQIVANNMNTSTKGFIEKYIVQVQTIFENIASYFQK